jgi:hypothetical protein
MAMTAIFHKNATSAGSNRHKTPRILVAKAACRR